MGALPALLDHDALPSVDDARLPVLYESAKEAIVACWRIDECKDWADRAAALASYARQSLDETLLKTVVRIQARATRRVGELLQEIPAAKPGPKLDADTDTQLGAGAAYRAMSRGCIAHARELERYEPPAATAVA
jgi:hypothetical protein